jgi:hypothetical protein
MEQEEAVELLRGGREALILAILTYLKSKGNTASSSELVSHFKPRLAPEDSVLFRSMLRQIATFNKPTKTWTVKSEFRDQ